MFIISILDSIFNYNISYLKATHISERDLWVIEELLKNWFLFLLSYTTVLCVESDTELSNKIFVMSIENILKKCDIVIWNKLIILVILSKFIIKSIV